MNKTQVLFSFFNSFGLSAYPSTAISEDAQLPYITYEVVTSAWQDGAIPISVSVWYRTSSEAEPNKKVSEISERIGQGLTLKCDEGLLFVSRGTPWCSNISDTDNTIKRRLLNIDIEYMTFY